MWDEKYQQKSNLSRAKSFCPLCHGIPYRCELHKRPYFCCYFMLLHVHVYCLIKHRIFFQTGGLLSQLHIVNIKATLENKLPKLFLETTIYQRIQIVMALAERLKDLKSLLPMFQYMKIGILKRFEQNTVFPRIVSSLDQFPPLNSFRGNCSIYEVKNSHNAEPV